MVDSGHSHTQMNPKFGGILEEPLDYIPRIITLKGPISIAVLTTAERYQRDELITTCMFGLEMLCHTTGGLPSITKELEEVERRYLLNEHAMAVLGLGLPFFEPFDDDVPTDEDRQRTRSDIELEEEPIDEALLTIIGDAGEEMED